MNHIRNITLVFFIMLTMLLLSSCGEDDGSGYIFKANLTNNPRNLDAQMATDNESVMIILNMMEGLMKTEESGAIVPAAAERFEMSEDGLIYTFYLKQGRKWDSYADFSADVTADDFVFAFQRLFDKDTNSPHSEDFLCIKNSAAVLSGVSDYSQLGVKALDDYTVEFTLEYPYFDFIYLLTKTAAMPCNRAFFEYTQGKYGMSAEAVASNGAFYLREWNYDSYWDNNYIIMRRNKLYSENEYVYPYSLNLFITDDGNSDDINYSEGDIDCYVADEYNEKIFAYSNCTAYQTKTIGLLFNADSEYADNYEIRKILAQSINRDGYAYKLSENLHTAYGIIPGGVTLQGKSYRDLSPDKLLSVYDVNSSAAWENLLKGLGKSSVDNLKITVPDSFLGSDIIYDVAAQWQEQLLLQCGVEIVSQTEYDAKISEDNFSIALVELSVSENSPYEFFDKFTTGEYADLCATPELMAAVSSSDNAASLSEAAEKFSMVEREILSEYVFVPLFYKDEYFVSANESADLVYTPFSSAIRFGNAKYYD